MATQDTCYLIYIMHLSGVNIRNKDRFNGTPQASPSDISFKTSNPCVSTLKVTLIICTYYRLAIPISTGLATRKCNNGIWGDPNVNDCEDAIFEEVRINVSPSALRHASQ